MKNNYQTLEDTDINEYNNCNNKEKVLIKDNNNIIFNKLFIKDFINKEKIKNFN